MADYNKTNIDLNTFLPQQYRDKTSDRLIHNLFNKQLTKSESSPLYGYVGDKTSSDIYVEESTLERKINQLSPVIEVVTGDTKEIFTWADIVQKMAILGIDVSRMDEFAASTSFNLLPPIDIDKFCNFDQYFWIGHWIKNNPSVNYSSLGIASTADIVSQLDSYDSDYNDEYYVIQRGLLSGSSMVDQYPDLLGWSSWAITNLWIHKEDLFNFYVGKEDVLDISNVIQATRPIIEYFSKLKLNLHKDVTGKPIDSGTVSPQLKTYKNQLPQFDVYDSFGTHIGATSCVFAYKESQEAEIDSVIKRRIVKDDNTDFVFVQFLNKPSGEMYFYKFRNIAAWDLKTIWIGNGTTNPEYVKLDSSGTIINKDKLVNYSNYYWIGTTASGLPLPIYNSAGNPEYSVIESAGTSDWSIYNYWKHASELTKKERSVLSVASRPIIEYNVLLEAELLSSKTSFDQEPLFKKYIFNEAAESYETIEDYSVSTANPLITDGYLAGKIISKVDGNFKKIVDNNSALSKRCFTINNFTFLQGLDFGYFNTFHNATLYGCKTPTPIFTGTGNGVLGNVNFSSWTTPEVLEITALTSTTFSVTGSVSGNLGIATVDIPFSGIFLISNGVIPFQVGDKFLLDVHTQFFEKVKIFSKLGNVYKTVDSPTEFLNSVVSENIVPADKLLKNGTWAAPDQLVYNPFNTLLSEYKQGDLYLHFLSIIQNQVGLIGSANGTNNFRNLSKNYSLGGLIKQHNDEFLMLCSLVLQENVSIPAIIDFAKQQYSTVLSKIKQFIETNLSDFIVSNLSIASDLEKISYSGYLDYLSTSSTVVDSSATVLDDKLNQAYKDSTSRIQGLIATIPFLGLGQKHLPELVDDYELGLKMLKHHDGHQSSIPLFDNSIQKKIVSKLYRRSNGQETPGIVTGGGNIPRLAFKNQFWYDAKSKQLLCYVVASDTGELPDSPQHGTYSYDRQTDTLYQFVETWQNLGSSTTVTSAPWKVVDLTNVYTFIALSFEKEIYNKCPLKTTIFNLSSISSLPRYQEYLKNSYDDFCSIHGILDQYTSKYVASDPFTWNYFAASVSSITGYATWQQLYKQFYGTSRPDLEPWIITQESKASFLAANSLASFAKSDWSNVSVRNYIKSFLSSHGKVPKLSVSMAGDLLPPYGVTSENLISTIPSSVTNQYTFADLTTYKLLWIKSIYYIYDVQKIRFKLEPLKFISTSWGFNKTQINQYEILKLEQQKYTPALLKFHGSKRSNATNLSCVATLVSIPTYDTEYKIECIDNIDEVFEISKDGIVLTQVQNSAPYSDSIISIAINSSKYGVEIGDVFFAKINTDGEMESSYSLALVSKYAGVNQWYVQYHRLNSIDMMLNKDYSLLSSPVVNIGYRFAGLIKNESLKIKANNKILDKSDYSLVLKENKYLGSFWFNALSIQLAQKGSTDIKNGISIPKTVSGETGVDWVFRIDNVNKKRSKITWYEYDLGADYLTFVPLNGDRTSTEWKRYTKVTAIREYNAPFIIKGIQNVINFLFGYHDYLYSQGWRFNDPENPTLDPNTGRLFGFQLCIEEFVYQQFGGVDAGSAYLLNPLQTKVWFEAARGVVASVNSNYVIDGNGIQSISNKDGNTLKDIRVFRKDSLTQVTANEQIYSAHLLTSEYEHVAVLNQYAAFNRLMFDPTIGQRIPRIHVEAEKQTIFSGRLSFGGQFLLNNELKTNIEGSISDISKFYDVDESVISDNISERSKNLLGFESKKYFKDLNSSLKSEFRFWQGMVKHKGTNFAASAFLNSVNYKTAELDEFWAYKLAEYGDSRKTKYPEYLVSSNDVTTQKTKYLFLEPDDIAGSEDWKDTGGYDVPIFDTRAFDFSTIYSAAQDGTYDFFDPAGSVLINPNDQSRWYSYNDLNSFYYFEAEEKKSKPIEITTIDNIIVVKDSLGKEVIADCFEIVNLTSTTSEVYYESGKLIEPGLYEDPKFKRINHCSIQLLDSSLIGKTIQVKWYAPALGRYNPVKLVDYIDKTDMSIQHWDPARNVHDAEAIKNVDIISTDDPAKYINDFYITSSASSLANKPWGINEVGKVWWNSKDLSWKPYSDSKLHRSLDDRAAMWGSLSDTSSIEVYEWIKSLEEPDQYSGSGEVAIKQLLKRSRNWYQTPICWLYSPNPKTSPYSAIKADSKVVLDNSEIGKTTAVFDVRTADLGISSSDKLCKVVYALSTDKATSMSFIPVASSKILSTVEDFIVGDLSSYNSGGIFSTSLYFDQFKITVDKRILNTVAKDAIGKISLSTEFDGVDYWLKAEFLNCKKYDLVKIKDTPIQANSVITYNFSKLGMVLSARCINGHTGGSWPATTEAARKAIVSIALGNTSHEIIIRSTLEIENEFDYGTAVIHSNSDLASLDGWVISKNPTSSEVSSDLIGGYAKWLPVIGTKVSIQNNISDLSADILGKKEVFTNKNIGNLSRFSYSWNQWKKLDTVILKKRYTSITQTVEQFCSEFIIQNSAELNLLSAIVTVNGNMIDKGNWQFVKDGNDYVLDGLTSVNLGDEISIKIQPIQPSAEDLSFDPTKKENPSIVDQYKVYTPHVKTVSYNEYGNKEQDLYFYWVKNKSDEVANKKMSINGIKTLLTQTNKLFCNVQALKFYNQIDGRLNRYAMLVMDNLGSRAHVSNRYKIQIIDKASIRVTDDNLKLKNLHEEWILIREKQAEKIPRVLWDILTDSAIGETLIGSSLPETNRILYDEINVRKSQYGIQTGQILAPAEEIKDVLKDLLLNSKVYKYDSQSNKIQDPINYVGFDISKIDEYFSSAENIRKLLSDIWRYANAKQINELFFGVLNTALARNLYLDNIFKTSYIALFDVKTLKSGS